MVNSNLINMKDCRGLLLLHAKIDRSHYSILSTTLDLLLLLKLLERKKKVLQRVHLFLLYLLLACCNSSTNGGSVDSCQL